MSVKQKNYLADSPTEYTVCYKNMGGVDFTSENNSPSSNRFSYLENMYRDYDGDGGELIESIPGFRKIAYAGIGRKVHSIFSHKTNDGTEYIVFHAGTSLYRFLIDDSMEYQGSVDPIGNLQNQKSHGFNFGNSLYILDGNTITVIDGNGKVSYIDSDSDLPYVPTTYVNGEEYEQRNLLSDYFYEITHIGNCDAYASASPEIEYDITSETDKTCRVKGGHFTEDVSLHIPSTVKLGESTYRVTEIAPKAFERNEHIRTLTIAEGIDKIGASAFKFCTNLTSAIIPEGLKEIEDRAFAGCTQLYLFNFGIGLKKIGDLVFSGCQNLASINYSGTATDFSKVENAGVLNPIVVIYEQENNSISIQIPIYSPACNILSVKVGGVSKNFNVIMGDSLIQGITIFEDNKFSLNGKEIKVYGKMEKSRFTASKFAQSYISEHSIPCDEAIKKCRVCESFDGRIFLSGNPDLPNTVFYSQRDRSGRNSALYFGILNYFNDGVGTYKVRSLLSIGDSIAVFKEGDDTGGSIYYHTPRETGIDIIPKVYPVSYIHSGVSALGDTISFFDSPLFVSHLGICAVKENEYGNGKSIEVRSHNINPKLLSEDFESLNLAQWRGYLVVAAKERMYLADSRKIFRHETGSYEYEWYFINGVATYKNERVVFRYSPEGTAGFRTHYNTDAITDKEVHISTDSYGNIHYYTYEYGDRYEVYQTEEKQGGIMQPQSAIFSYKDSLLFFGTENGDICLFNSDKRGQAPVRISEKEGFDADEYRKSNALKIHSDFYDFAGHSPNYVVRSVMDDCTIPHFTKNTVKNSFSAKLRVFAPANIKFEIKTDKSDYEEISKIPDSIINFEEIDFSSVSFINSDYSSVALKEKEKGWIEKQLQVSSNKFRAPFGISSMSYRFYVKGRIKNT